ncbi:hypothetical protein M011DRAFT_304003 [Sporormia fimetaria CBS 119925]|uniref:Uncharacterized protein n=1 Tax=Sporormia fimetaria CBS 119925 TaxID=1340428 RepID=A0A6A6VHL6_9PLEO|nr:hypothetical protein M011DRAFT_304003 [Sporormia fimetaria CBS 119925]
MKVIEHVENGIDRTAEVHLCDARGKPLDEYDEFEAEDEKAVCCYVPVEAGRKVNLLAEVNGSMLEVCADILVDGVCRRTTTPYKPETGICKNTKLRGLTTVLFPSASGKIFRETGLLVTKLLAVASDQPSNGPIGTLELRLYVLRQHGEQHLPKLMPKYYESSYTPTMPALKRQDGVPAPTFSWKLLREAVVAWICCKSNASSLMVHAQPQNRGLSFDFTTAMDVSFLSF